MKPRQAKCEKLCPEYPCTRTECGRKQGWDYDGKMTMLSEEKANEADYRLKKMMYNELRNVFTN